MQSTVHAEDESSSRRPGKLQSGVGFTRATGVASGKYLSADEALVAGGRLLRDRERPREELRRELDLGLAVLERGDVVTLDGEGELYLARS